MIDWDVDELYRNVNAQHNHILAMGAMGAALGVNVGANNLNAGDNFDAMMGGLLGGAPNGAGPLPFMPKMGAASPPFPVMLTAPAWAANNQAGPAQRGPASTAGIQRANVPKMHGADDSGTRKGKRKAPALAKRPSKYDEWPDEYDEVHAPLLSGEAEDVLHDETNTLPSTVGYEIPFGDPSAEDEALFEQSKQYLFGDYLYPCVDVSYETARRTMWDAEEAILRDERSAWDSDFKGRRRASRAQQGGGYGAVATSSRIGAQPGQASGSGSSRGSPQVKERVIDMEAERMQSGDPNDVKLKWNKVARLTPPG